MFEDINNKIFVLHFDSEKNYAELNKLLSPKRREELSAMQDRKKAISGLLGEAIVRIVVAKTFKMQNIDICFEKGEFGKPYLINCRNFNFNISHSQNYVAVAFSPFPVGVDIEVIRDCNFKIAERYFTKQEREYITSPKEFLEIWTLKEAVMKQSGEGFSKPMSSFSVLGRDNVKSFFIENSIISVCSDFADNFKVIKLEEKNLEI